VTFQVAVTFSEQGDKTKLIMRMLFDSAEERENVVAKYGAVEGADQTLDRLTEHLTLKVTAT
jgi:Activator of Hsp90 ATPase homolog 1-like protein